MKRLGSYILVGAGLIGGFASLVSMDPGPLRSVLTSAFIFLLVVGLLWWLDDRFSLRNSISILMAARQLGISRIYRPRQVASNFGDLLASSKSISILSVSGINLINRHKPQLVAALANNKALIRVLLATPGSQFVEDIEIAESPTRAGQISRQIEEVMALLREYHYEATQLAAPNQVVGKLKLGHFHTHLRSSVILCDNRWGWLTLNLPPKRAVDSVSIEVAEAEDGLLRDLTTHFDAIWRHVESKGLDTEF